MSQFATILQGPHAHTALTVVAVLCSVTPIIVSTVLFVRIAAVYPFSTITLPAKLAVYGVPLVMRAGRVVNWGVGMHQILRTLSSSASAIDGSEQAWLQGVYTKVECTLQVLDNS